MQIIAEKLAIGLLFLYLCIRNRNRKENIMHRKTDGLPFEVHRSPSTDENGNIVLYATPLSNRTKDFDELEGWIRISNSIKAGELQHSFDAFMDECSRWLGSGYRVQTPLGCSP